MTGLLPPAGQRTTDIARTDHHDVHCTALIPYSTTVPRSCRAGEGKPQCFTVLHRGLCCVSNATITWGTGGDSASRAKSLNPRAWCPVWGRCRAGGIVHVCPQEAGHPVATDAEFDPRRLGLLDRPFRRMMTAAWCKELAGADPITSGMAGRYATALFELALEDKATDKVKADLERFDALVAESADLLRLVRSPVFTADEQTKALQHCWHRPASPGSRRISSCSWRANGASSPYARWLRPIGRWSPATRAS